MPNKLDSLTKLTGTQGKLSCNVEIKRQTVNVNVVLLQCCVVAVLCTVLDDVCTMLDEYFKQV